MGQLEAKLQHEQEKFKTYNKDLKEAEKRYALKFCCCSTSIGSKAAKVLWAAVELSTSLQ